MILSMSVVGGGGYATVAPPLPEDDPPLLETATGDAETPPQPSPTNILQGTRYWGSMGRDVSTKETTFPVGKGKGMPPNC